MGKEIDEKPHTSASTSYTNINWLENADFSSSSINPWFNRTEGDSSDVMASNSSGQADFLVLGDEEYFSYVVNFSKPGEWDTQNNPFLYSYPEWGPGSGVDQHEIRATGFWSRHAFQETARQNPSVHWVHDVELPDIMDNYEIISAEVTATVNATVNRNIDVDHPHDYPEGLQAIPDDYWGVDYDYLYTYVRIAKPDYNPLFEPAREVAWNKTKYLGLYNVSQGLDERVMDDTDMTVLPEAELIDALSTALSKDEQNFTIIVGVDFYCEDNFHPTDEDEWENIYINDFSLNFTYRKKINQFTSISWIQKGEMINHTGDAYYISTQIDNAELNFKYKINQDWPSDSFNSEINFLINNVSQAEYPYTKLRSYNYTELQGEFKDVIEGGYDITDYILLEENITLAIQIEILDGFELGSIINISIDEIEFIISYTVFTDPPPPAAVPADDDDDDKTTVVEEPWVNLLIAIGAIAGGACLGGYLVAYQLVLKYPKQVRKVRKFRKALKKKQAPDLEILGREKAFKELYNERSASSFLKVKIKKMEQISLKEKPK